MTIRLDVKERGRDVESGAAAIDAIGAGRNLIAVIGIDRYHHWQRLSNGVRDARGAAALFQQLGFEHALAPLLNDRTTCKAIWSLVTDELESLRPEDNLVVFYAGHGGTRKHRVGNREVKTGYLIPVDAHDKASTWVDLEGWLRSVALLPPRHILVILDSCHSGIALDPVIKWRDSSSWREEPLASLKTRLSRRIITSALDNQIALDSGPVHGHSLFTGCLIEALTHDLKQRGGKVTTGSELGLYLQRRVETYPQSQQTPDFGTFAFDDRGEMVLSLPVDKLEPQARTAEELLAPSSPGGDEREAGVASPPVHRRRGWLRWLVAAGAVLLVLLSFSTQRYLAARALATDVDAELGRASDALDKALGDERVITELETWAFAEFDIGWRDDGEITWKQVISRRGDADLAFRNAARHVEIAFNRDPTRRDVRDVLGEVLFDRALHAEHVHDLAQRDELIARLEAYDDDGSRHARWSAPGRVIVHGPDRAAITLESGGQPDPRGQIGTGNADLKLPPGSYVVVIAAPGRVAVRAPILVERDHQLELAVDPPRASQVPAGYVYVPAGEFLFGHANEVDRATFFTTTPLRRRTTPAFLIGRTEVTFGDWLEYVAALPPDERGAHLPDVPNKVSGILAIKPDGAGRWQIALQPVVQRYTAAWGQPLRYPGRDHRAEQDWRKLPVTGVSALDATAFAAWLDRTGKLRGARLCNEVEWERAARGADDRTYPGEQPLGLDDINVDDTYGIAMRGPDEVGSHPASRSPFGLDDMSGNALEWTVAEPGGEAGEFILRSGSYWHDRKSAQVTDRSHMDATVRDAALGFRLCAAAP